MQNNFTLSCPTKVVLALIDKVVVCALFALYILLILKLFFYTCAAAVFAEA